ncbi:coiled-coil domain-containing protein 12-like [Agrilus planipennis]|uniref:Coiled-coil domain-containing protein 12 n=1 Tax=Agrilus planipennis TaxID=224129 RepID=A0A1W4WKK8_AGRPL|nr:coiled-coil domain-containing protein 12 [Agrilus planipennis]XP_025835605.1 coiled-coil domain-containing protein 12-like [Agrilus planipennis]
MTMSEGQLSTLQEEALKRKERLKALKRKRESENNNDKQSEGQFLNLPKPKFRSYKPQDEELQKNALPLIVPDSVEDEIKEQLQSSNAKVVIDELDITSLAPRKPDWDLKRDVAKKLEKLERRTQKAIAELIRERLKKRQADLATIATSEPAQPE